MRASLRRSLWSALTLLAIGLLVFGGAKPAMAADAPGNWYDITGGPLISGQKTSASIGSTGDVDWYYFYNAGTAQVKVNLSEGSGGWVELDLYRWDGGYLRSIDSEWGYGTIDRLLEPGLYYVEVSSNSTGTYGVTVTGSQVSGSVPSGVQARPSKVSRSEDNTTGWWNAQGGIPKNVTNVSSIHTNGDTDWYYFYTSGTAQVTVGLNNGNGNSVYLDLYRWDGGYLRSIDSEWGYGLIDQQLPAGLYYIEISSTDIGSYDFTVSGSKVVTGTPSGVQAHPLPVQVTENYKDTAAGARGPMVPKRPYVAKIDTNGDEDWYYFYNSGTAQVRIGLNSAGGVSLELYQSKNGTLEYIYSTWSYGIIDQQLAPGLYYLKASSSSSGPYDITLNGSNITSKPLTDLKVSAPSTTGYGASATIKGTLKDLRGKVISGRTVTLQRSYDKTKWTTVTSTTTSSTGSYSFTQKPKRNTYYRVKFAGDTKYRAKTSAVKQTKVKILYKAAPTMSTYTHKLGKSYTVSGQIKPKHASGSKQIKIYAYRYEADWWGTKKWVYKKSFSTKISNPSGSSYSKYTGSVKLPDKGKWRLRAYHAADSKNAKSFSSYRYVTVK